LNIIYVLILTCTVHTNGCKQPETTLWFASVSACQKMADDFNTDRGNQTAGTHETCIKAFPAP
jgi:hypothetical protein